jgi:hypothetical protein
MQKQKKVYITFIFLINITIVFSDSLSDYSQIETIFFPSIEGSNQERELVTYIENFCIENSLQYKKTKIDETNSLNLEINLNNDNKNNQEIIIIANLNSRMKEQIFYDNSISIQIMLDLIKYFKDKKNEKNITFLFSGANTREFDYNFYGLRSFMFSRNDFDNSFVVFLDILSVNEIIKITGTTYKKPIPLILIKKM